MEKKFCDGCDRHCPVDALHCGKGRKRLGMETKADKALETGTAALLNRCGRMLRRAAEHMDDPMSVLSVEEQAKLEQLLTKLAEQWKEQLPAQEHHGRHH